LIREAEEKASDSGTRPLKRTLSALHLASLGVGATIFVLTGHAAAAHAGPAVTLSFLLGAAPAPFAGLCNA
jgi:APA family basic amino acid/polyamine antiporter